MGGLRAAEGAAVDDTVPGPVYNAALLCLCLCSPAHSVASATTFDDQQQPQQQPHINTNSVDRFQNNGGTEDVVMPSSYPPVAAAYPAFSAAAGLVPVPVPAMQFAMSPRAVTPTRTRTPTPTPVPTPPPPPGPLQPPPTPLIMQASPTTVAAAALHVTAACQSPPQHHQQQLMTMPSPPALGGGGAAGTQMSPPPINIHAMQEAKEKLKQEKKEKHATKKLMKELAVCKTLLGEMEVGNKLGNLLRLTTNMKFYNYYSSMKTLGLFYCLSTPNSFPHIAK